MKYYFGKPFNDHSVRVEAKDKLHAIKIFKVTELFPEKCVDGSFYKKRKGLHLNEYISALNRYNYVFKVDDPPIYIYEERENNDWEKIGSILLSECINVDFRELLPQVNLLEAPKVDGEESEQTEMLPIIGNAQSVAQIQSKLALREEHDAIALKKAELEMMMRQMDSAMNILKKELQQKQKIVYIIETYLGIHEEVVQIADGDPAPENSPLTLFQQKLYMDEEVGIWDDPDGQGIDCQEIEQFDEWITKHYMNFAYEPLSIVVWQVRRNDKQYNDVWSNVQFNRWNKATYFLIRNGSKLYRIWSNVSISSKLFPTKNEYLSLIKKEEKYGRDHAAEALQKKHENYLYGLIAIQGIIERTDILGSRLRQNGINLLKPRNDFDGFIKFIRDAEPEFWIGDGKPRWTEFLKSNRETICKGSRVCLSTEKYYFKLFSSRNEDNDKWRCEPFKPSTSPHRDCCYSVKAFKGESPKVYFPSGTTIQIKYQPGDFVGYDPITYEEIKRKRRVPWFLYIDEVINFDEITLEQADYYLKSRLDRENYIRMLPTLHWIRSIKLKELAIEDEFAKMICGQLKWDLNFKTRQRIQDVIDWWKLKNKWKRAITIENSTATRMILRRLRKRNQNQQ